MVVGLKPLITETTMNMAKKNWYTFVVPLALNKNSLKPLIEKTFKVEVEEVRTAVVKGKAKRSLRTRKTIRSSDWKKAMVRVKEGQKIEMFDTGA